MSTRRAIPILIIALAFLALAAYPVLFPPATPEVFKHTDSLTYDQALEQVSALPPEDRPILILDFGASWCGPCKRMDADTWSDPRVKAWLDENALPLQIDVDHNPDLARTFNVSGIPDIVAVKDGNTIARVVGYHSPEQLLAWFDNLKD